MSAPNFEDILNLTWDELPETQQVPNGSYLLRGSGAKFFPANGDANAYVLFVFKVKEAMDDVDEDELKAMGDNYDLTANKVYPRFWIEDNSDWDRVREFLKLLDIETKGRKIPDTLKEVRGKEIVAFLERNEYTNKQGQLVKENRASNFTKPE